MGSNMTTTDFCCWSWNGNCIIIDDDASHNWHVIRREPPPKLRVDSTFQYTQCLDSTINMAVKKYDNSVSLSSADTTHGLNEMSPP